MIRPKLLLVLWAVAAGPLSAAGPIAGTLSERTDRLQRNIDRASERGDYSQMLTLRRELADLYADAGAYALAARQYELLLASRPGRRERVVLFIKLGKMRFATEDYGRAIGAYQDALHDDPDSWEGNLQLARAYAQTDLNSRAIDVYQKCMHLRPTAHEPYEEIAAVYQRIGFLNKAISFYEKALKLEPTMQAYLGMADCYVSLNDVPHATEVLQRGKTVLPRADYDVRLGEIYRVRGELARAAAAWEEALKFDARRDDVRLNLYLAYEQLGRQTPADALYKMLSAAYPDSPLVHFIRAWTLYAKGHLDAARRESDKVASLEPTPVVQHYNELLLAQINGSGKTLRREVVQ